MKTTWMIAVIVGALVGIASHLALRREPDSGSTSRHRAPVYYPDHVAANGVVEGARPEVALRPEVAGTIAAIYFHENQDVSRGCLLAELNNETQKQQVALTQAEVAVAKAELEQLHNGARPERRKAVAALESARRAVYEQAQAEWERSRRLVSSKSISQESSDAAYFQMLRVQADWEQARAERAFVEAPARADEVAAAEGRLAAAEARLRLAQAELAKTRLAAPFSGRVLRVYREPGELVGPASAQPVLLLADLSKCRVRAFVEELDAPRVKAGQSAVVTVDGLPNREFRGTVVIVMPRMGKRSVQADTPEEYKDLYFREVLIDLDSGDELMLNLRVKTQIKVDEGEQSP